MYCLAYLSIYLSFVAFYFPLITSFSSFFQFKDVLTRVEQAAKRRRTQLAKQQGHSVTRSPGRAPAASTHSSGGGNGGHRDSGNISMSSVGGALPKSHPPAIAASQEELYTFQTPRNVRAPYLVPADGTSL